MTRQNIFPLIFMIGISIIPILSIEVPRGLSFLPLLFGLGMSTWWVVIKKERLVHSKNYLLCLLSICGLCIISTLWSISPMESYMVALKASAILLFSVPLFSLALSIKIDSLKPFLWLFPASVATAAALCSLELAFDLPLYRIIHDIESGQKANPSWMNRGVVCAIFSYFTAFLFIRNIESKNQKNIITIAMTASIIVMLFLTQSQSAQLAFILGSLMLFLFPHKIRPSFNVLALLVISAMILTPWIVSVLFVFLIDDAQTIPWLQDGYAGNRLEIWNFVMNYALNNPLYGYGMEATRFVTEFEHDYIYHKKPTVIHPHNFSVQIWMEFGVLGIISASALFMFLAKKIKLCRPPDRKAITSTFIAVLTVSSIGYGIWQSWWLGELLFICALCVLMTKENAQDKLSKA